MSVIKTVQIATLAMVVSLLFLFAISGCNSTPTVPVPPPEFCDVSPPDADGLCTVGCEEGQTARNIALVYNDSWGAGVMQETEEDGSFEAEVDCAVADTMIIQIKYDRKLSAEVAITVPSP